MRKHFNLFTEAAASILRNRSRSFVIVLCLLGVLVPFITDIAISVGVRYQSSISVSSGADLYVSSEQYGRNGPIALSYIKEIEKFPGVTRVVPRIVGRSYLGEELAVIAAIDSLNEFQLRHGESNQEKAHILFGPLLAEKLDLVVGDEFRFTLLPTKQFKVTGILEPKLGMWSSSMVIIPFADGEEIFQLPGLASELLIYCRPGMDEQLAESVSKLVKPWDKKPRLRVQTKQIVKRYINRGFDIQAGIFSMFYVTALGLGIPALLILAGFGRTTRKKEIGILKATGWQTLEVMEMTLFENLLLAIAGSFIALLISIVWLKLLNGIGIAPLFISGIAWVPDFPVPAMFTPLPALLSFLFGIVLTLLGTLVPTWRTAVTPPLTTMG